jgi:hypothetical protein
MICHICNGMGWFVFPKVWEWWPCPCCGGAGVSFQHGPALIGPGTRRRRRASITPETALTDATPAP